MDAPIIDPLLGDFPEVIEEYLEHGCMKCIAFNRRGTLLAAGCNDGSCIIWDFETRGIAKELWDYECSSPITSIHWSKYGHRILVSAADESLTLWDVKSGEKIKRIVLQQTPLQARLHPGSSTPSLCFACPVSCAPMIVDLNTGDATLLKVSVPDISNGSTAPSRNKSSDGLTSYSPTAACFNKYGSLVYVGNSKGEILIIDHKGNEVRAMVPISGGSVVKSIVFSRNGRYLLTNKLRDDEELEWEHFIKPSLLQAIKESLSAIVVLSANYASSSWCLDELLKILHSKEQLGLLVFPIFYGVDPSDIWHQTGNIGKAFEKHEEKFIQDKMKVQRWRNALEEVQLIWLAL